ncbi:unnamed protein product [Somion occarium]|uniref:Uncharacterized protein n=1 Tax=Somion occarium TaxID=3059160 RepID=A0ABP1DP05_9APHY
MSVDLHPSPFRRPGKGRVPATEISQGFPTYQAVTKEAEESRDPSTPGWVSNSAASSPETPSPISTHFAGIPAYYQDSVLFGGSYDGFVQQPNPNTPPAQQGPSESSLDKSPRTAPISIPTRSSLPQETLFASQGSPSFYESVETYTRIPPPNNISSSQSSTSSTSSLDNFMAYRDADKPYKPYPGYIFSGWDAVPSDERLFDDDDELAIRLDAIDVLDYAFYANMMAGRPRQLAPPKAPRMRTIPLPWV